MNDTVKLESGRYVNIRDLNGSDTIKASVLAGGFDLRNAASLEFIMSIVYTALSIQMYAKKDKEINAFKDDPSSMVPREALVNHKVLDTFWSQFSLSEQKELMMYVTEKNFQGAVTSKDEVDEANKAFVEDELQGK